jgi:hypothetical protein
MTHRILQIVDRVADLHTADTAKIYKNRRQSLSAREQELPATSIDIGEDSPIDADGASNLSFLDSVLTLAVTHRDQSGSEEELIEALIRMRTETHVALMADRSLGLDFVIDTQYAGALEPELDEPNDGFAGSLTSIWRVHYRMNITDPQ